MDVCTNYRFARRRQAGAPTGRKKEEKTPEPDAAEAKKKVKKVAAPAKGKKGAAKTAAKEDEAAANELNEAEKKQKEDQEKKRLEDEARALQKPKAYTAAEVEAFEQYCKELEQFFGDLVAKQLGGGAAEGGEEPAAGDEQARPEGDGADAAAEPGEDQPAEDDGEAQDAGEKDQAAAQARFGKRDLQELCIEYDFKYLCESARAAVPEPVWPDPDKEPLPPPVVHQIVRRPPTRPERKEITMFSIWTPAAEPARPASAEEGQAQGEDQEEEQKDPFPPMTKDKTRWVLGPKESAKLYIKFFSQTVGSFSQTLKFEIVGSPRAFDLNVVALCELPRLNEFYKNVFMSHKKTRPPQLPDSIVQKTFVVSENVFDFGPLLIKKDPELRADETIKKVNSSVLRITNDGEYPVEASFTLKSTLPADEGGIGEKSPFILEPESMSLAVRETKDLTVFAFPE